MPRVPSQLSRPLQDNLRTAIKHRDWAVDLNHLALQLTHVSHVLQVAGEHNHGEGTDPVILAEIEKGDSATAFFDAQHSATDAAGFANVFFGFSERDAIGDGKSGENNQQDECQKSGTNARRCLLS